MFPPSEWNATERSYDRDALVHELVAAGGLRDPGAPALLTSTSVLTHGEVAEQSDRVAALLHELGVGRGDLVALLASRTPRAVVALLGVLKAGAAYVPLDVRWPRARVEELLRRHAVRTVLTDTRNLACLTPLRASTFIEDVVCLDAGVDPVWSALYDDETVRVLWDDVASADDPAQAAGFDAFCTDDAGYGWADAVAYRDHVDAVARRLAAPGARVLEIGCGSGLLAGALTGWTGHYVGVDPSPVAIDRLRRDLAPALGRGAVETHVAPAHEAVGRLGAEPVDLAVMASVVHFLPGIDYLLDVLDDVATAVRPGGAVLLADLIDPDLGSHAGMTLPPEFFHRLVADDPRFAGVEVLRRSDGTLRGELRDRYDVVLTVAAPTAGSRRRRLHSWADVLARQATAPECAVRSTDLAYVIFTSGSTGAPKGVEVEHRSVVNLIDWVNRCFGVSADDRLLFVTAFAFDLSVYDMFGILAAGAGLYVMPDEELGEPDRVLDVLESERITFWDSAPAALSAVLPFAELRPPRGRDDLRRVFLSGDWVPLSMHGALARTFPAAKLVALGGATECTVWSNAFEVDHVDPDWPSVPYGRPMQNARYYVLDEDGAEQPVGVEGDLHIAGDCVARGYAGDPGLTAEKFVADTVTGRPDERMYRTGDRARWLPEGVLQFRGRLDNQVKVRGFRVELGEVQSAIARCRGVRECVVLAVPMPGEVSLAGFFVAERGSGIDADSVRRELMTMLPGYLVPTRLVQVSVLPVSATGKVDRATLERALAGSPGPAADGAAAPDGGDAAAGAPVSMTAVVTEAWSRVLGTAPSTTGTSFFAAGGSSLTAVRLAALLRERTGRTISVRDVFATASVERISELLETRRNGAT